MGYNPKGIDSHASKGPTVLRNQGRDKAERRRKREDEISGIKERAKKITRQKPTPAIAIDSSMQYE